MDYLDPKKKKLKRARILVGYALMGVAISIATVVMVYLANGYYIDSETGTVIQNGLVYIDSKPESAEAYLNGEKQRGSTPARLVVPEGSYSVELKREGYRPWSRSINLEGGNLRQLTYARLVPNVLDSELAVNLPFAPTMTTQSIDKRWLVMASTDDPFRMRYVDLESSQLTLLDTPLPLGLIDTKVAGSWQALEWADDNKTFLATYTTDKTTDYVLIDRDDATKSKNLGAVFPSLDFTSVSMRNRKNDLVFLYDDASGAIFKGNVSTGEVEPYLNDVIDYVAFGDDALLYVSSVDSKEGFVNAILKSGTDEYLLREIKEDKTYLLEMSKLGNALVMGVGSPAEGRVIVYNDPLTALKENDFSTKPVATTVLRIDKPQELSISSDSSVIMARSGQTIASHEFEADRSYNFEVDKTLDPEQEIVWLDGQHMTMSIGGVQYMMDFDGSNLYELVKSVKDLGVFYERNVDLMYTFTPGVKDTSPNRITRTFMRSVADR